MTKRTRLATRRKKTTLVLIAVLLVAAIALAAADVLRNGDGPGWMAGSGGIKGVIVNEQNEPLQAVVFVLGTDLEVQSDLTGAFALAKVPAGNRVLIVGYRSRGQEFTVRVRANTNIDLGPIRVDTTNSLEEPPGF